MAGVVAGLSLILSAHAYYVTICQIDHNVETASLEITFKFFTDDLERALREAGDDDIRLTIGAGKNDADAAVSDYVGKKFRLTVNGTPAELDYVGKEVGLDTTYVYVEVLDTPYLSTVDVRSRIFLELFEEHTTMVHVRTVGMEKSLVLKKDTESGTIELQP